MNESPEAVAQKLSAIYERSFGGKNRGRYKISRVKLRQLSGRKRLEDSTIDKIINISYEMGYVVVDLGDYFAVVEEGVMNNYRPVPQSVVADLIEDDADVEEPEE